MRHEEEEAATIHHKIEKITRLRVWLGRGSSTALPWSTSFAACRSEHRASTRWRTRTCDRRGGRLGRLVAAWPRCHHQLGAGGRRASPRPRCGREAPPRPVGCRRRHQRQPGTRPPPPPPTTLARSPTRRRRPRPPRPPRKSGENTTTRLILRDTCLRLTVTGTSPVRHG